jgi:hypothetical protein
MNKNAAIAIVVLACLAGAARAQDSSGQILQQPLQDLQTPNPVAEPLPEQPSDGTVQELPQGEGVVEQQALPPAAPPPPEKIANEVAEFSGLDKITGRTITFDVYIDETVQFGTLQVTPRICYSRPATETPKTDAFVEVDEITLDRNIRRIFTGWMFADSPGLNAIEHPIYDVWLKNCKMESEVAPPQ